MTVSRSPTDIPAYWGWLWESHVISCQPTHRNLSIAHAYRHVLTGGRLRPSVYIYCLSLFLERLKSNRLKPTFRYSVKVSGFFNRLIVVSPVPKMRCVSTMDLQTSPYSMEFLWLAQTRRAKHSAQALCPTGW